MPKKKNLILFIGKSDGQFLGNVKYLYLHLQKNEKFNVQCYFFTRHKSVYEILKQNNLPVVYHPTLLSLYLMLRTNILIVNSTEWRLKSKYYLLFCSKKIQLWHGISLKHVELAIPEEQEFYNSLVGKFESAIRGKFINYDLAISTSDFYTKNVFSKAFKAKTFLESGYPRNDIFFTSEDDKYVLLGADQQTISRINKLRTSGHKIILYVPTWRDTGGDAITDGILNLNTLSQFGEKNNFIFVFKSHLAGDNAYTLEKYNNIIKYDNSKDPQPLLKISDVLITDYSSIYMDYLLLDRPVIFFPYDYEKYTQKDRGLFFDYDWITPGPKCYSQDELEKTLTDYIVGQKDDFSARREEIRNLAFKNKDGNASKRIWNFIKEKYINV